MRWRLVVLAVAAGCGDPAVCCIENAAGAVVEGSVVDAAGRPLALVGLRSGGMRSACGEPIRIHGPAEGETRSDGSGWFRLSLASFLGSTGRSCVDIVITAEGQPPDTVRGVEAEFFLGPVRDTSRVVLRPRR